MPDDNDGDEGRRDRSDVHPEARSPEDEARSRKTVRQLIDEDLADRRTPSRRHELEDELGGEQLEGFDVDLREYREPPRDW